MKLVTKIYSMIPYEQAVKVWLEINKKDSLVLRYEVLCGWRLMHISGKK